MQRLAFMMLAALVVAGGAAGQPSVDLGHQSSDFDGDGFDDMAVGVPGFDVGDVQNAGAVLVIHGTSNGLRSFDNQLITQGGPDDDGPEPGDRFGHTLAWGDFDGDGFSDLAIGVPLEDVDDVPNAGTVQVIYGSPAGLDLDDQQVWHQDTPGLLENAENGDQFGWSLATGDFNGDGRDDLAIGAMSKDVDLNPNAGAVAVLYGSTVGLRATGDQYFTQALGGLNDRAEPFDQFGFALAAGDFNGDDRDDLAIGIPGEDVGGAVFVGQKTDAGAVAIVYGSVGGLTRSGDQFWHQDVSGIADFAEIDDRFGWSLAAGDFNGDRRDDLAIGVPEEDLDLVNDAGAFHVIFGTGTGLRAANDQFFTQDTSGVPDNADGRERFGFSLAAGDFNGDAEFDLAVGTPAETLLTASILPGTISQGTGAGAVHVFRGVRAVGLTASGSRLFHQDAAGMLGRVNTNDRFGEALWVGDFDRDRRADLAIGVPGEKASVPDATGLVSNAGAVAVLYGGSGNVGAGLTTAGDQLWSFDLGGLDGRSFRGDLMGMRGPTSD